MYQYKNGFYLEMNQYLLLLKKLKNTISGVFFGITWVKFSHDKLYTNEKE